jgi:Ca2+-binding RTX toxin-like protein
MRYALLVVVLVSACDVEEVPIDEMVDNAIAKGKDPCADPHIKDRATVKKKDGKFVGTNGRDVIVGTEGPDVIFGLGGDDLICGLGGADVIDGGDGRDRIFGGDGNDIIHGRGGSDYIYGGDGNDVIFGDILDDQLFGDAGDDILIGGHGTDTMYGGDGNDFMRGDTGNDKFIGGGGFDTVSFATTMPPGQPENTTTGIHRTGNRVDGDGGDEPLDDIEAVIHSAFVDDFDGVITPAKALNQVFLMSTPDDAGVVVLGTPQSDVLKIIGSDDNVRVEANHAITAGVGCSAIDANSVRCSIAGKPFHFVTAWGDAGGDTMTFSGTFPRDFEAHASGGEGNDHLIGGDEQDVFFTGPDGNDVLEGNDGDDALISESHHTAAFKDDARPKAENYHDGGDILDGGPGNDQLVADYICAGHVYIGGSGRDIAGFARSGKSGINAQLHGPASFHSQWWGFAANMDLCRNQDDWTKFKNAGPDADLEVLEASDGPDHLWGDDRDNVLWGRAGGDHLYGLGGDDELLGADGNDVLDGGGGDNTESYGLGE